MNLDPNLDSDTYYLPTLSLSFPIYKMEILSHRYSVVLVCAQDTVGIQQIVSSAAKTQVRGNERKKRVVVLGDTQIHGKLMRALG